MWCLRFCELRSSTTILFPLASQFSLYYCQRDSHSYSWSHLSVLSSALSLQHPKAITTAFPVFLLNKGKNTYQIFLELGRESLSMMNSSLSIQLKFRFMKLTRLSLMIHLQNLTLILIRSHLRYHCWFRYCQIIHFHFRQQQLHLLNQFRFLISFSFLLQFNYLIQFNYRLFHQFRSKQKLL